MLAAIKKTIVPLWYRCFNQNYRAIKASGYFDCDYYTSRYPDVSDTGIDPLYHYVSSGYVELRQPGPLFDPHYYIAQVPELAKDGGDPLIHYLYHGRKAHKSPTPYFDPLFYLKQKAGDNRDIKDLLLHYLHNDVDSPASPYFAPLYYQEKRGVDTKVTEHALLHYLHTGRKAKIQPSPYFDIEFYVDTIPGLSDLALDPLSHYFIFGVREGKSPNPVFDPSYYRKKCDVPVPEMKDPFKHYMEHGESRNIRPCSWFDPLFYKRQYPGTRMNSMGPLAHYLRIGVKEGCFPNGIVVSLTRKPLISIIVPVYNVSDVHLNNCIRSILYQSYPNWEICLADDCSTSKEVRPLLEQWALRDKRIKVIFLDENLGISGATNAAVSLATGTYLGFLDNDDELTNECLFKMVQRINNDKADLLYSDEDLIGEDGRQFSVFAKPDYNKELLLGHNYVTHFVVVEKDLYNRVGGFDPDLDGAQDFDLFLKLSEQARNIVHIPEVLYHWRASETSTSINHDQKDYADEAGRRAVANALQRRKIEADVLLTEWKFFYRIQKEILDVPRVSVVIAYNDMKDFDDWFCTLLSRSSYADTEFMVVAESEEQILPLRGFCRDSNRTVRFVVIPTRGSLAARYNSGVHESSGEYVIFLNSLVQLEIDGWIEALLECGIDNKSGMVGGRVLPFSGTDLISTLPDLDEDSELYYARFLQRCSQHMNGLQTVQDVLALSWDLAMVERKVFLECEGFDEKSLGHLFADSDLCLRLRQRGYENIYTPHALGQWLVPEERQTLSVQSDTLHAERNCFQRRWQNILSTGDPYYNLGLLDQNGIVRTAFLEWYAGCDPVKENL